MKEMYMFFSNVTMFGIWGLMALYLLVEMANAGWQWANDRPIKLFIAKIPFFQDRNLFEIFFFVVISAAAAIVVAIIWPLFITIVTGFGFLWLLRFLLRIKRTFQKMGIGLVKEPMSDIHEDAVEK